MRFGNSSGTRIENDGEKEGRISGKSRFPALKLGKATLS